MNLTLDVTPRTGSGESARRAGDVPGVVYGPKQESIPLEFDRVAFERLFSAAGESSIIVLRGLTEDMEVLVHDVAYNPVKGGPMHVDFYAFERGKELNTNVPLEFSGEPPVEKQGGIVNKVLHEVAVSCRPSDLPAHLAVDLTELQDFDSQITIADLDIPTGVTVHNGADDIVVTVSQASEEPEPETEAVDPASIPTAGKEADTTDEA